MQQSLTCLLWLKVCFSLCISREPSEVTFARQTCIRGHASKDTIAKWPKLPNVEFLVNWQTGKPRRDENSIWECNSKKQNKKSAEAVWCFPLILKWEMSTLNNHWGGGRGEGGGRGGGGWMPDGCLALIHLVGLMYSAWQLRKNLRSCTTEWHRLNSQMLSASHFTGCSPDSGAFAWQRGWHYYATVFLRHRSIFLVF